MREPENKALLSSVTDNLQTVCRLTECYGWFVISHGSKIGFSYNISEDKIKRDDVTAADMVWYQPVIDSGKAVYIDASYDEITDVRGVFLDYIVRENDQVLGVVGTYERLDDVLFELLPLEGKGAINLLVDEGREIRVAQSQLSDVAAKNTISSLANQDWSVALPQLLRDELTTSIKSTEQGNKIVELSIGSYDYLSAIQYIDQVEWFAISLYPKSRLGEGFNSGMVTLLSVLLLLTFIGITLLGLNTLIIAPLQRLNKVVDHIQSGDYSTRAGNMGVDIIQNLATGIDKMSAQINAQIASLNQSNAQLQKETQRAEEASEAKSMFLSNMSHEIRTPLNGVLGTLQLIRHNQIDSESKTLVTKALQSARSLLVIINDILDFSKIEANMLALEQAPFSFLETLESVISDVNVIAKTKGVLIVSEVEDEFVDGWLGDSIRVRQILLNLVSNAVKFSNRGSVNIEVSSPDKNGIPTLSFTVTDSGIGMSQQAQDRIFERFNQADSSTTRKYGGTGLGMSITLSLIRLMSGNIEVDSKEDIGTEIRVSLPLDKTTLTSVALHHQQPDPPDLSGYKLLIAEDNDINQTIIDAMLTPTGAALDFVENGRLAVQACQDNHYDLILMDIQMPEMDGEEAFKQINTVNKHLPVIALTANVMTDDVLRYEKLGFITHVGKPINLDALYSALAHILLS